MKSKGAMSISHVQHIEFRFADIRGQINTFTVINIFDENKSLNTLIINNNHIVEWQ